MLMIGNDFIRPIMRVWAGLLGLASLALAASPASARADIAPYLEVQQVLSADLNDGDVLTYTAAVAGIDGQVSTRRFEAQISYRYEHRFAWDDDISDSDIHTGVAQARLEVVPDLLSFDAGALAARSRIDPRGAIVGFNTVDSPNVAEVFSAYVGPTLSTRVGDVDVGASYRLGYVHVDDHSLAGVPGEPLFDRVDSSVIHNVNASVGMEPGRLPFGWTIGGGYAHEEVDRLDREFDGAFVRGDIVVPVSRTVALTAGVGYENIETSQQDILRDANGIPIITIITPDGELVADPSQPRLVTYDQDGLIYDAGIIWRPSHRTELQARVGHRYGGTTVIGSFHHQFGQAYGVTANVYDSVSTFGQLTLLNLNGLPTDFNVNNNPFRPGIGGVGGCVFGEEGGSGVCFDDAFQSVDSSEFRTRGANILFSGQRGPWGMGVGAGYSQRRYLQPEFTIDGFGFDGREDESFTINGYLSRALSSTSGIDVNAYGAWFDSDAPGVDGSFGAGISGTYYRTLWIDHLQGFAAVGLFTSDSENFSADFDSTVASGIIGIRYTF
jgi:hypothetical protein